MAIMTSIEAYTGCDRNKYIFAKHTESCRWMRGAWETDMEYILELCTERLDLVGCNVVAHVISAGVLSDTPKGKQCELFMK
jgi:hypothetical protein